MPSAPGSSIDRPTRFAAWRVSASTSPALGAAVAVTGNPRAMPTAGPTAFVGAGPAALELDDLGCTRGDRTLFTGVSVRLAAGELLRVRGPNGAGKTSLLRIVCGLAASAAGGVRWCGQPIADQREAFNAGLVYLGDAAPLNDRLTAHENLLAASAIAGRRGSADEARAALAAAGLRGSDHLPVRLLSQGQRRRAALARLELPAPAGHPGLWVLDEPFNALDDAAAGWLVGLIRGRLATGGIVVLTSHQDVELGIGAAERVIRL